MEMEIKVSKYEEARDGWIEREMIELVSQTTMLYMGPATKLIILGFVAASWRNVRQARMTTCVGFVCYIARGSSREQPSRLRQIGKNGEMRGDLARNGRALASSIVGGEIKLSNNSGHSFWPRRLTQQREMEMMKTSV